VAYGGIPPDLFADFFVTSDLLQDQRADQLRQAQAEAASALAELASTKRDFQSLEAKLAEAEVHSGNLAQEINHLRQQLDERSKSPEPTDLSLENHPQVIQLRASLDSERQAHESLTEELQRKSTEYAAELQQATARAAAAQEALESAREALKKAREQHKVETETLRATVDTVRREMSEQLSKKDSELHEFRSSEASMLERLHDADRDAAARLRECQVLRGLAAQKDEQIARLEADLRSTREEGEQLVQDFNALSHEYEIQQQEAETTYVWGLKKAFIALYVTDCHTSPNTANCKRPSSKRR
jgi:chromosome segregation ATPase